MTDDRYKELMIQVGMPDSNSLLMALKQVANEVAQEYESKNTMFAGVAIRGEGVLIKLPRPARHIDCFKYAEEMGIDCEKAEIGLKGKDQGFYTNTGIYLDREQAFRYAEATGIRLIDNPAGALCSENLW